MAGIPSHGAREALPGHTLATGYSASCSVSGIENELNTE
jgi:hypothetical protein